MNKFISIVMFLAVGLLLGGCLPQKSAVDTKKVPDKMSYKTLSELIATGKPLSCEYVEDDPEVKGGVAKMYISGKKYFVEMNFKTEETEVKSNSLMDGQWVYNWSSAMPGRGMKFNLDEVKKIESGDPETKAVDMDRQLDYRCEDWKMDEGVFVVPKDVDFVDNTKTMLNLGKPQVQNGGNQPSACSTCDLVPDASAKQQCREALKCK